MIPYFCEHCGHKGVAPDWAAGKTYSCPTCRAEVVVPVLKRGQAGLVRCPDCGATISKAATSCVKCGRPMQPAHLRPGAGPNRFLAGMLAFFLGAFGLHKFYMGYGKEGLIMHIIGICTCGFGYLLMAFYGACEGISYWTMSDQDFHETYVVNRKGWL